MLTGKLRSALFLGLDADNIRRLTGGEPIRIPPERMAALGFPRMTVVLHYGETQEAMLNEIAAHGEKLIAPDDPSSG